MKNNSKGFTIIELLVVISIIGLLSTISVVALNGARKKSRDAKRIADIDNTQTALELYFNDYGAYPKATSEVTLGAGSYGRLCDNVGGFVSATTACTTTTYMGLVPKNPTPALTGFADYLYLSADGSTYRIKFGLEDSVGALTAGYQYGTPEGISK